MDRTQLRCTCPGSLSNYTVIAVDPAASFGVGNPANIGSNPLSIGGLDASGNVAQRFDANGQLTPASLVLYPGDTAQWYTPPSGTMTLVFTCSSLVPTGDTILEYDTPNC